ncbi:MAG: branched-chain amino acid aminotransferase [Methanobacteriota archaeon]|nr:MAG: branched-chain amino acid aminotransferase [Euryarchaeota archaeon]
MMKQKIPDDQLTFGTNFTDRMLLREYKDGAWQRARIMPFQNFTLSPAALVFHYGQAIFEGLKAFRQQNGRIVLFRPDMNAERMYNSAKRLVMPPIEKDFFVDSIKTLVKLEKDWVPTKKGTALYIRPTMIATEAILGVRPSSEYYYFVILSPSAPYFKEGFSPTKIKVEDYYVRAALGGVGEAKTAGNYAASLYAAKLAKEEGYSQVLWLDACNKKYVEEVGAMNIAFVLDDIIYTSPLRGTILPGITRNSVLQLSKDLGYKVKEEALAIDTIVEGIESGALTEVFGMGTAAIIAPVGELKYKDKVLTINNGEIGPKTRALYEELTGIQYGLKEDKYGWIVPVE